MSHELASGVASGFFSTEVIGHLRPVAQIVQWNIAAPNPSGGRHIESGSYKKTAHVANRGGFTAQMESGAAIDFGNLQIPGDGSGFNTDTVALTLNMGEANKNVNSRFDQMFNDGSGTASTALTLFNFRMWVGNLDAFNVVAFSGANRDAIKINPIFHFQQSAEWRQSYDLLINQGVSGVEIMPSSMLDSPNITSRENDISISGAYKDREFTNFIYIKGEFPTLPVGTFYKLGTYGGLGLDTFTLKFSYDYTALDANIIDPTDLKDFPVAV